MLWMNIYLYLLKVGNAQIFHVIHKPSEVGWGHCIRYGLPRSMWPMVASPPGMVIPRYWYVLITSFNPGEKSSRKQDVKWYLSTAYESDKQQWTCIVAPTSRTCKRYILFWVNHKEDLAHWVDWMSFHYVLSKLDSNGGGFSHLKERVMSGTFPNTTETCVVTPLVFQITLSS